MFGVRLAEALTDCLFERRKVRVIDGIQALLFNKLPQAFNQIQVGRVRGQVQEFNLERGGQSRHQLTFLVAGVIQDQGYGHPQLLRGQEERGR
mgnify:CR=1 FL=1